MELKEYQIATLKAFTDWRAMLASEKTESQKQIEVLEKAQRDVPPEVQNYPKTAWKKLRQCGGVAKSADVYVDRCDGVKRPIPHVCFKVPTGGGKTLLAAASLERLNRQTGFTLWITPTKTIYKQTKATLWNREHPYRQMLERASGGRVKMLEKDDLFTASDVVSYLCVMLLTLPATNREKNKEFLRMFRDSGNHSTFFPDSDDALGNGRLLSENPDLECGLENGLVKQSLFNVIKMLRPVVVLDEAHRAYGNKRKEEFVSSVNRLNPSLVIELSATPNQGISNLLVDVTGIALKNEEMIKLPVKVTSFTNSEWQDTLAEAYEELNRLTEEAKSLQHDEGRYVRPIAVVRVERTGRKQRDGGHVHAEDVREYLVQQLGVSPGAVRVKSAEKDELGSQNLLSEFSEVQWIITKAALMEGWDCPFAYLLVILDNTKAQVAITQLMGRVMRQPAARRTRRERLDQCYVYCWNTNVKEAVEHVKAALEQEGLTGLDKKVIGPPEEHKQVTISRRKQFREKEIFLPMVLHRNPKGWEQLDYLRHILPNINWESIDAPDPKRKPADAARRQSISYDLGDPPTHFHDCKLYIDKSLRISWFVRRLSDIIPNPWQAARIVQRLINRLKAEGETDDTIHDKRSSLSFELQKHVSAAVEKESERVFRSKLTSKEIRFDLEAGECNFRMVDSYEIDAGIDDAQFGFFGHLTQLSLFEPIYEQQFDSDLERNFARYLDEQKALQWWHRVAANQREKGGYYLQGWKQGRIWPDFVAMGSQTDGKPHVLIFETKGEHLRGNPDTDYKERVLKALQSAFNLGTMTVRSGPAKGTFRLVFNDQDIKEAMEEIEDA